MAEQGGPRQLLAIAKKTVGDAASTYAKAMSEEQGIYDTCEVPFNEDEVVVFCFESHGRLCCFGSGSEEYSLLCVIQNGRDFCPEIAPFLARISTIAQCETSR